MTNIQSVISTSLQVASVIPGKDIVGVFDQSFNQVFQQARPMELRVQPTSKLMRHPLETGSLITDHQIFLPVELEMDFLLSNGGGIAGGILSLVQGNGLTSSFQSLYQQIDAYYKASTIFTIQTKVSTFQNMVIEKLPHVEKPEMWDGILLKVRFSEAQFVSAQYSTLPPSSVVNPTNASTLQIGEQQAFPATTAQIAQATGDIDSFKSSLNLTGVNF